MFWLWRRGICRPHVDWPHKWNESYRVICEQLGGRCWSWACRGFHKVIWALQVGNQLEAQFTETLEDVVYCGYNCRSSHVGEGITMVQNRGARILMPAKESTWCNRGAGILMSGKESTWCNTEKIQKFSLCGTHPETLTRRIS